MRVVRIAAVVALAAGGLVAPVVTPTWAAPTPVTPVTHRTPISGVDAGALATTPKAFDPQALRANGGRANATGRADPAEVPAVYTKPLDTGHFAAAGVTWTRGKSPASVTVQVRVREDGTWSDWYALDEEGGPDPGTTEARRAASRASAGPIAAAHGDSVQVRVDVAPGQSLPADLAVVTVDPGSSPADAAVGTPGGAAHASTVMPSIVTRAQWGADESLRPADCSPDYSSTIKAGVVHHTVNTNTYSASESAGLVRSIYAFHIQGNGWCDIGYNFLVDRFGVIFEGRYGGMDHPVIGAHAGGFNLYTFGVSGIGDFTSQAPSTAMTSSISRVLGWKLGLHNRSAQSSTVLVSAGGPYTNYPAGTPVTVRTVSGHRDVDATGCPGDALYPQLDAIAAGANAYMNANGVHDEDLYAALTTGTGSGKIEVHGLSLASGYSQRLIDAATDIAQGRPDQWRFMVGSYRQDGRPDLIAVQTIGTPSGRMEVHVVSWASYYRQRVMDMVTPMGTFAPDGGWQLAVGGPGGGDLYVIGLAGTGSGRVEVHALSATNNYAAWTLHSTTALTAGYPSAQNRFLVARTTGDLYLVAHGPTGSGQSEVHTLTAASGYQAFSRHAATPLGPTSDGSSAWALGTDPIPSVIFVGTSGTGTGRVEVHRLSQSSNYGAWTLHAATPWSGAAYPGWQFSFG